MSVLMKKRYYSVSPKSLHCLSLQAVIAKVPGNRIKLTSYSL